MPSVPAMSSESDSRPMPVRYDAVSGTGASFPLLGFDNVATITPAVTVATEHYVVIITSATGSSLNNYRTYQLHQGIPLPVQRPVKHHADNKRCRPEDYLHRYRYGIQKYPAVEKAHCGEHDHLRRPRMQRHRPRTQHDRK